MSERTLLGVWAHPDDEAGLSDELADLRHAAAIPGRLATWHHS